MHINGLKKWRMIFFSLVLPLLLRAHPVIAEQEIFPCTKQNAYKIIEEKDFTLLICSFGSPPVKKKGDSWNANGVAFHKIAKTDSKVKQDLLLQIDEFEPAVDYSYKDKTLTIIRYTEALPDFKLKPFLKEMITLSNRGIKPTYTLLSNVRKYSKADISAAVALLKMSEDKYRAQYQGKQGNYPLTDALYKLRDYAVDNPAYVDKELISLRTRWWCDGEMAEILAGIKNEVKMLKKMKTESN